MAMSNEARFVPGIWGPYLSVVIPGLWLNEGGQSATGALLEHVVTTHSAYPLVSSIAENRNISAYELLNERVHRLLCTDHYATLTKNLHVFPDFHGNRSPLADPSLCGMITGLKMSSNVDDLTLLYLATIQAISLETRHIIEVLNTHGYQIDEIVISGGLVKNELFVQCHADSTGCKIYIPHEKERMLLGASILGLLSCYLTTSRYISV